MNVPNVHRNTAMEGRTILEGRAGVPPTQQGTLADNQSPAPTLKYGRPPGSKDPQPQKRKKAQTSDPSLNSTIAYLSVPMHEVILDYGDVLDEICWPFENCEISFHYAVLDEVWNQNEMVVDDAFVYIVSFDIMLSNGIEPHSVDECRRRMDWSN
ncbi:hypothetical protein ACFX13_015054 [Malus domestica]